MIHVIGTLIFSFNEAPANSPGMAGRLVRSRFNEAPANSPIPRARFNEAPANSPGMARQFLA